MHLQILSRPNFEAAVRFVDFRKALGDRTLKKDDPDVKAIAQSPYFFIRTTLSVLLSLVKTAKGAVQEHSLGNFLVLLPLLWPQLRETEKWQIGQAYAEVNAGGNRNSSAGLKSALLKVQGFDFVPETLRSSTFSETAARVLAAHFRYNNFSNEAEPMESLSNLGTAIPRPAFPKCMEAVLAVWLGNHWGHSWMAEDSAKSVLDSLRTEQWEYYFNECLRRDRTVLDKLSSELKPINRWIWLADHYNFGKFSIRASGVQKLISSSIKGDRNRIMERAEKLRVEAVT